MATKMFSPRAVMRASRSAAATRASLPAALLHAALLATMAADAVAQDAPAPAALAPVTVTGPSPTANAEIGGFGGIPLARTPLQASVITAEELREGGGTGLTALTRHDASVSDAYNAEGYWTGFTVRGFVIDNRSNFLRDGLPISAETSLPLDNKARVEVLKGTSGMQAGLSAPGGLVNLIVKRPDADLRAATLGWRDNGSLLAAADLSQRFGAEQAFGLRLNVAAEHLDPPVRDAHGERHLIALAGDWRPSPGSRLEAEIEYSHQSERSVPGFSLLGSALPDARDVDPRINLNNQPWSLPVVLDGTTGSLRWTQDLGADWKLVAHGGMQRLHTDDRLAYSFGCSKENNFQSYCSDGTFDYYDFRSDGELRETLAFDLHADGRFATGAFEHRLTAGVLETRFRSRYHARPDDGVVVSQGSVDGMTFQTPVFPTDEVPGTNLDNRSTELYLRDRVALSQNTALWAGLRQSWMRRESVGSDGSEPTAASQTFTTPWLALSYSLSAEVLAYASWGEGVESEVTPNKALYLNAGQALPSLKSRQAEIGLKRHGETLDWSLTAFDIRRPQFGDACDAAGTACTHQLDGHARHRGLEAEGEWRSGNLALQAAAMWLDARLDGSSIDPTLDGKRPTNVPSRTLKLGGRYALPTLPGLGLQAGLVYEGPRMVLPDNSVSVPGWTRLDLAARYQHKAGATTLTWLVGVDNATDRRAWRESPFQYGHAYLFPLAPRTWRVMLQAEI